MRNHIVLACAVLVAPFAPVRAAPDPAVLFGAREGVEQISLSPDGSKVAFIAPMAGQGSALYTAKVGKGEVPVRALVADGKPARLVDCRWVSDARLLCTIFAVQKEAGIGIYPISRLVAVDADGANIKLVSLRQSPYANGFAFGGGSVVDWLPGQDGRILIARTYVPEAKAGTLLAEKRDGLGVDRVDTRTLAKTVVEKPSPNASEFISDGRGTVRILGIPLVAGATQQYTGKTAYRFRRKGTTEWEALSTVDADGNGFNPYAVDPDLDAAFGLMKVDGRTVLARAALDGSGRIETVFSRPDVDVDDVIRIGRSRRVVGAGFATERRDAQYFDPALAKLAGSLSKALPGLPLVRIIDASTDETKLLVWAGSDVDPGRYYVLDRPAKALAEVMLVRPELEGATLAQVKPVRYRAADGTMIPAYLTLPPGSSGKGLPAIVLPHGGPGARDEWGFDWLAQFFAARGYAVIQPNFRGSAGYGDAWFQKNGFQSWRIAVGDVVDAGRWLVSEGIAAPSKLGIVGWSYGGYAALQSNVLDPDLFKAVIAVAPVTDLALLKTESAGWTNRRIVANYVGSGPHIVQGSPAQNVRQFKAPVLLFHGTLDRNVGIGESRLMENRLRGAGKPVELVSYPDLDHNLDDGGVRADLLRRSDAFLRKAFAIP